MNGFGVLCGAIRALLKSVFARKPNAVNNWYLDLILYVLAVCGQIDLQDRTYVGRNICCFRYNYGVFNLII